MTSQESFENPSFRKLEKAFFFPEIQIENFCFKEIQEHTRFFFPKNLKWWKNSSKFFNSTYRIENIEVHQKSEGNYYRNFHLKKFIFSLLSKHYWSWWIVRLTLLQIQEWNEQQRDIVLFSPNICYSIKIR